MAFLLGEGGKGGGREGGNLNKVHLNRVISLKQRESKRESKRERERERVLSLNQSTFYF